MLLKNGLVQDDNIYGVPIKVAIVPKQSNRSSYVIVKKTYLVFHETGNTLQGAGAKSHNNYLRNTDRDVSWEFTVDSKEIYQNMPINVPTYHAYNSDGNAKGIGIEICVNSDGDFEKAKMNAVKLATYLFFNAPGLIPKIENNSKSIDNMKATITGHFEWYDKQCPYNIIKSKDGFLGFQQKIIDYTLEKIKEVPEKTEIDLLNEKIDVLNKKIEYYEKTLGIYRKKLNDIKDYVNKI